MEKRWLITSYYQKNNFCNCWPCVNKQISNNLRFNLQFRRIFKRWQVLHDLFTWLLLHWWNFLYYANVLSWILHIIRLIIMHLMPSRFFLCRSNSTSNCMPRFYLFNSRTELMHTMSCGISMFTGSDSCNMCCWRIVLILKLYCKIIMSCRL